MSNLSRLNKSISNIINNILSSNNPDFQGNLKTNPSKYQQLEILLEKVNDEVIKKNIKEKMNSLRLTSIGIKEIVNKNNKRNYVGKLLNSEYFEEIIKHNGQTIKVIRFNSKNHDKVTDEIFAFLKNSNISLTSVHTINLAHCYEITDDGLINLAKSCPNLQSINLDGCWKITDDGLIKLAQSCPNLQSINLASCKKITDDGLINLAQSCSNLQSINLEACNQITDDGLINLAKSCPNLQNITLERCNLITYNGLINFIKSCPNLQSINLYGLFRNSDIISNLRKNYPRLKIIS